MTDQPPDRPPAFYAGLGIQLALPIVLGALGGNWLDGKYDTAPLWVLVGSILGIATGFWNFFKEVIPGFGRRSTQNDQKDEDE